MHSKTTAGPARCLLEQHTLQRSFALQQNSHSSLATNHPPPQSILPTTARLDLHLSLNVHRVVLDLTPIKTRHTHSHPLAPRWQLLPFPGQSPSSRAPPIGEMVLLWPGILPPDPWPTLLVACHLTGGITAGGNGGRGGYSCTCIAVVVSIPTMPGRSDAEVRGPSLVLYSIHGHWAEHASSFRDVRIAPAHVASSTNQHKGLFPKPKVIPPTERSFGESLS